MKMKIDCDKCERPHSCCETGAWVDLEEAKKIIELGLKGDFYHLEKDPHFPSGYRVGTSYEYNGCSFLTPDGLCSIHIADYSLKPAHCIEFPYENGRFASFVEEICHMAKPKKTKPRAGKISKKK